MGPSTASGAKSRITSIDSFVNGTGLGSGWSNRRGSSGRIRPNSSDSRRQPLSIRAAHRVLLPEPGRAGMISAMPSFSTTAECSMRNWWACIAVTQFRLHSKSGKA